RPSFCPWAPADLLRWGRSGRDLLGRNANRSVSASTAPQIVAKFRGCGRESVCRIVGYHPKEPFMPALTSDIAKFVASISAAAVPERCNFGARIGMLDCVGTMIAGANEEAVRL